MHNFNWKQEIEYWLQSRPEINSDLTEDVIRFFERAFENTLCPDKAWFGAHVSSVSLVVGGIFLAAIVRSGEEKGVWLLVDQNPPPVSEIEFRPVKATRNSHSQLTWAHSSLLSGASVLSVNDAIWDWYRRATLKIFESPRYSSDRDEVQLRRGKWRLNEFWQPSIPTGKSIYPDEIDSQEVFIEGVVSKVVVNAYERNPVSRQKCITHYGACCYICGFEFEQVYGMQTRGIIHVHHERPLSEISEEYEVDPIADLKPVCPNCHAIIHSQRPAYSVEQVRFMIKELTS